MDSMPDSLANLALRAFAQYVSNLLRKLMTPFRSATQTHLRVQEICKRLTLMICSTVPASIASEVTASLLAALAGTHLRFPDNRLADDIASCLATAVIHREITTLDYLQFKDHPTMTDYINKFHSGIIFNAPPALTNLKVLRIKIPRHKTLVYDKYISGALEEIAIHSCCDKDVKFIASVCENLRSLDISHSSKLTDASVQYILKFRHLEEIMIEKVSISIQGVRRLLEGLAQCEASCSEETPTIPSLKIKTLSCGSLSETCARLVADKFQNLTSLSLNKVFGTNLTLLSGLKHLQKLTLKDGHFHHVAQILPSIGTQLHSLRLHHILNLKFSFIVQNCPSLQCLDIYLAQDFIFSSSSNEIGEYTSVQCLHLAGVDMVDSDRIERIVSVCTQLKKLHLQKCIMRFTLFDKVVKRERLNLLKECSWRTDTKDRFFLIRFSQPCISIHMFDSQSERTPLATFTASPEDMNTRSRYYFDKCFRNPGSLIPNIPAFGGLLDLSGYYRHDMFNFDWGQ